MIFSSRKCFIVVFLLGLVLTTSSCTFKKANNYLFGSDLETASKIFSNRPELKGNVILILKLSQPALLSSLKQDRLKNVVDAELSKAIREEQSQIITKLKQINPEILVLYRYKMVLNAMTIVAPVMDLEKIQALQGVSMVKRSQIFDRPLVVKSEPNIPSAGNLKTHNSALFIGAKAALDKNISGQNIKVGIIDTGIDYTHSMLGGSGLVEDYKSINPDDETSKFPNAKVVGGIDFVGTKYNAASEVFSNRIPIKDKNPMDQGGHGSHVAGTVAGIGDGINSYDGVAPSAQLYALKVFGAEGSTSDEVVIAALEYAADPNGDENLDDHLDVVNLSLGSSFGPPRIFYNLAIKNLTLGGTAVVCSAGNSGNTSYIVGAPSVSDEALSVAASVDSMDHNWKFKASVIEFSDKTQEPVETIESSMTKPIALFNALKGKLVYMGNAKEDFNDEQKNRLKDNVALIDRGEVPFADKIKRSEHAGAIGVVVINNQEGDAFAMGGNGKYEIPAIMITKNLGDRIKESMKLGDVVVDFKSEKIIEKPNLIDTVADFSSRGPRSEDSLIKPEISAPGVNIISAALGLGKDTVKLSGTSMSGPQMAGVMALMKQFYPEMTAAELKSIVMGTSKTMVDFHKIPYPISRVGAGRVQIDRALDAHIASKTVALSLGDIRIDKQKKLLQSLVLKNIKPEDLSVTAVFDGHPALSMEPKDLKFTPRQELAVDLKFSLTSRLMKNSLEEVDGYVKFYQNKEEVFRLPVLAIVRKISGISSTGLVINSTSKLDSDGSLVELSLTNQSDQKGLTIPMNLIGTDDRKKDPENDFYKSKACDLQSVGYKVLGGKLYIGYKLYQQVTTWDLCELNLQIDSDQDGFADQEIIGAPAERLEGLPALGKFITLNFDAQKVREIRKAYDKLPEEGRSKPPNYAEAVIDAQEMIYFDHSSIGVLVIDMAKIKPSITGELLIKVATSSMDDHAMEPDDYLDDDQVKWRKLDLSEKGPSFLFNELFVELEGKGNKTISLTKGQGLDEMILFSPTNKSILNSFSGDDQAEIVRAKYIP